MAITANTLKALSKKIGSWKSEPVEHGHGSLVFRCLKGGAIAGYYRYMDDGKRVTLPIGRYDPEPNSGATLADIRGKAQELSKQHATGMTAIKEKMEADVKVLRNMHRKQTVGTFGQLLEAYVDGLRSEGKSSASDVQNQLRLWVVEKHPDLLCKKAGQITTEDIMSILTSAAEAKKNRTVNQLRSYLLAAFNRVLKAKGNALLASSIGTGYDISANPAANTVHVSSFDVARDRVLNEDELKDYLEGIEALPFIQSAALKLSLMLGGQRPQQLIRLKASDVNLSGSTLKLLDPKGKRKQPRTHVLPIPEVVHPLLERLMALNAEESSIFGKLHIDTLTHRVQDLSNGSYQMKDIRRTCETMMAAMGISRDTRAQIQSHGLSGVQEKYYDQHDYMKAKVVALDAWNAKLVEISGQRIVR